MNVKPNIFSKVTRRLARAARSLKSVPTTEDAKSALAARSDISITNPTYLTVGAETYVGPQVNIFTPSVSGIADTALVLGRACVIGKGVELSLDPGSRMVIGEHVKIGFGSTVLGNVTLGNYTSAGPGIFISSGKHYAAKETIYWLRRDQIVYAESEPGKKHLLDKPVYVGEDVALGTGCYIRGGVYIGKGAIIGANSVVVGDIPPYATAMGSPCRVFDRRLSFEPPRAVLAVEPSHFPYFYEGFHLRKAEWEVSTKEQVIYARPKISVMMNGEVGDTLEISGRVFTQDRPRVAVCVNGIAVGEFQVDSPLFSKAISGISKATQDKSRLSLVLKNYTQVDLKWLDSQHTELPAWGISSVKLV